MNRRTATMSLALALAVSALGAAPALAGGPVRTSDAYTVTFFDDFIFELCGIEADTTLTERWVRKDFPDGSSTLQVTRTFVPDDPRIPIEKGAGTGITAADGSKIVVGSPIRLYDRHGGIRLLDAGRVMLDPFGDVVSHRGHSESFDVDLLAAYCP
jgi:hypothetical protein